MNVIAWLEFELTFFETAVQHFSHSSSLLVKLTCKNNKNSFLQDTKAPKLIKISFLIIYDDFILTENLINLV